jgi:hemolysin activation/secretion protein
MFSSDILRNSENRGVMRWYLKLLVVCCGVSLPSWIISIAPSDAASIPDLAKPVELVQDLPSPLPLLRAQTPSPTVDSPVVQPNPNQDNRFLQDTPLPQPVTPAEQTPVVPVTPNTPAPPSSTPPSEPPVDSTQRIRVQQIDVVGSTIFSENDLASIVDPYEGRDLTLEELRSVADRITQLYLDGGYITSRAVLVDQVVTDGVVQIQVIEGSLEQIEIQGNQRVNSSYIRSRVQLGGRTPLNQGRLEDQLRLLRLDPLFENVEASLRAGSGLGQSILTVRVTEANPFYANVSADNYSPPSVGSERVGVLVGYRNLTGLGDDLSASYYRSTTGGSNVFDFSYQVPINPMNGIIQLRVAPSRYRITDSVFEVLDIRGNADLYELSFRQPLVRSPREEFALSVGFTYREGETLISDITTDSSTTSVFKFGQEYVRRDVRGAWALRSQFNLGTDLFDATTLPSPLPDGQFFSWLGQVQRVQILNQSHLLILQADVQLTPDPLLPSQQFVIGGGQSVRGFRQNVRSGDNGFRLSIEDRIALQRDESGAPTLQLAPFADAGLVWNADGNPVDLPDQTFLAGVGLGVLWEPLPRFNIRLDFTVPLIDLADRGENAQDDGIYFSVNYQH